MLDLIGVQHVGPSFGERVAAAPLLVTDRGDVS
jgi:hypothetical protein